MKNHPLGGWMIIDAGGANPQTVCRRQIPATAAGCLYRRLHVYPDYRPELLSGEIRQWIEDGVWEKERIVRQITEQAGGAMDKKQ